jgi:general stress protein 26
MKCKQALNSGVIIISFLCSQSGIAYGQHKVPPDSLNSTLLKAANEIIRATQICTLITIDESGAPRARAMDAFLPDEDFIIWFGTNPQSRKVKQILLDSRVVLYYFDKATASYVTLSGNAEIVTGHKELETHWKEPWHEFYPDYPEGYVLIKVIPVWLEVISESRGITGNPSSWQPPKVVFDSK